MAGTVVITGANGSLALGFVEALLSRYPQHTLIATVRNTSPEKDSNTAELMRIISKYPNSKVNVEALDLACQRAHFCTDNIWPGSFEENSTNYSDSLQRCHFVTRSRAEVYV